MFRNLKVLVLAAMALTVAGAVGAPGAQAVPEFHCSVEPCIFTLEPDEKAGTKTAHHVIVVKDSAGGALAFTCDDLTGEATLKTKTVTELTFTNPKYDECSFVGQGKTTANMNGCDYVFTAEGKFSIRCPTGGLIEFGPALCQVTIGEQLNLEKAIYHNVGNRFTFEMNIKNIAVKKVHGTKAGCGGALDPTKTPITAEYTTGNTLVSAETDPIEGEHEAAIGWWV